MSVRLVLSGAVVILSLFQLGHHQAVPHAAATTATATPTPNPLPASIMVETFAEGLNVPIAMAWDKDGYLYHSERNFGVIQKRDFTGTLVEEITPPIPPIDRQDFYGFALDPDYPVEPLIYVFYIHAEPLSNRVLRFRYQNGEASDPVTLLDAPIYQEDPGDPVSHFGGNLHFGADGMLYISLGDNDMEEPSQDMTIPQGKIVRINPDDGAAPPDNPYYDGYGPNDDRIWALGFRNPFDFDFDPFTGSIWASENGPGCGDEINYIVPGGNYGWPISSPGYFECVDPGDPYLPPAYEWTPTIAPTGITIHTGATMADWHGSLMMCAWKTGLLYRFELDESRTHIVSAEEIDVSPAACKLDVATGPDGSLYMTTRNGEIYRLKSRVIWLPLINQVRS